MSRLRKDYHLYLAWLWVALLIPSLVWWKESIVFVIILSLYANFEASLAAHEAKKGSTDAQATDQGPRS